MKKHFDAAGKTASHKFSAIPEKFFARHRQLVAIQVGSDMDVTIPVRARKYKSQTVDYTIFTATGKIIKQGRIFKSGKISFFAAAGKLYFVKVAGYCGYFMNLKNVPSACYTRGNRIYRKMGKGFHFFGGRTPIPMYFFVPGGTKEFSLELKSNVPGETAILKVHNPDGKQVAELKTVTLQTDARTIKSGSGAGKVWKLELCRARKGVLDDAFVYLGKGLSGWLSFDPGNMLIMQPVEK